MASQLKTVRVYGKKGPMVINESDYDPKLHKLFTEPKADKGKGKKEPEAGATGEGTDGGVAGDASKE